MQNRKPGTHTSSEPAQELKIMAEEPQSGHEKLNRRAVEIEVRKNDVRMQTSTANHHGTLKSPVEEPPQKYCELDFFEDLQWISDDIRSLWWCNFAAVRVQICNCFLLCVVRPNISLLSFAVKNLLLFGPVPFVAWIRPLRDSFHNTSSLNFMLFSYFMTVSATIQMKSALFLLKHTLDCLFDPDLLGSDGTKLLIIKIVIGMLVFLTVLVTVCCAVDASYLLWDVSCLYKEKVVRFPSAATEFISGKFFKNMRSEAACQADQIITSETESWRELR